MEYKICKQCNGLMTFDPYFKAYICSNCKSIMRDQNHDSKSEESKENFNHNDK